MRAECMSTGRRVLLLGGPYGSPLGCLPVRPAVKIHSFNRELVRFISGLGSRLVSASQPFGFALRAPARGFFMFQRGTPLQFDFQIPSGQSFSLMPLPRSSRRR